MQVGADILLVIATVVAIFSLSAIISAWTVRRWPVASLIALAIAVGLYVYVHVSIPDGLTWQDIPNSFITVAARVLN